MKEMFDRLYQWAAQNMLNVQPHSLDERMFVVPKFGTLYLLVPNEDGKLLTPELYFTLPEEETLVIQQAVEDKTIEYFLFEFGKRFYYCKPVFKKDQYNEQRISASFTDFKYVGKPIIKTNRVFNHLGVHTEYEILNGSGLKDYIKKAKFMGNTHLGIVDRDTLAGTLAFQMECIKEGIKSIIGETVTVASNYDPDSNEIPETYEVKLYVKDFGGWQNLLQINKIINVDHQGFIPEHLMFKYANGLVMVLFRNSGLDFYQKTEVLQQVKKLAKYFPKIYYQIDTVEFYADRTDITYLKQLNEYFRTLLSLLPPVIINDSYYVDKDQYLVKEYLNKVAKRAEDYSEDQYFKNIDETMAALFKLLPDNNESIVKKFLEKVIFGSLLNLQDVCNMCEGFVIETGEHKLPKYEFAEGETNTELFDRLIAEGFRAKVMDKGLDAEKYFERLQIEREVIVNAGFVDYFLILWDIVKWSKTNGIIVGVGRGSIGGSLLAFLIDLTDVDPIRHNLLFERFINEARISGERAKAADSLPDVDIDFESAYRDVVKQYINTRFGELHTCSIGTYTRLKLKGGIKDFGSVKGLKFSYLNFITAKIDNQLEYNFRDFVEYAANNEEIYKFFQQYPDLVHVIKFALNQPKAPSIHASGVLVLPKTTKQGKDVDVYNWLPVRQVEGRLVSEWEGKYTDRAGFLKEDILGLNQLDKFRNMLKLIRKNHRIDIDLNEIPFNDIKTYKLFQKGFNEDVFQFNSNGLKSYSRLVKPDNFEDLIAMNALFRPGPMDSNAHIDFALFKHGKKKPVFDYGLKEVTANTQGLYVYQEQIMMATVVLGGFSKVEADILRTQIKKFDRVAMTKSGEQFINGAIKNGCPPDEAPKIWNKLLAFSGYGFNRSHSAAYAMMSYQTQWLKANYPLEFWTTTIQFAKEELIPIAIGEMNRLKQGIKVKPPSINYSQASFTCDPHQMSIYWSLVKIKGLGSKVVTKILNERKSGGLFANYEDFVKRTPKKEVNRGHIEKMILAGCFDEVENIHVVTDRLTLIKAHYKRIALPLPEEYSDFVSTSKSYFWIIRQKLLTGYGDVDFKYLLSKLNNKELMKLYVSIDEFIAAKDYKVVVVCGQIVDVRERYTKKKDPFLILKLLHNNEVISVTVWADYMPDHIDFINASQGKMVAVRGKVKNYKGENGLQVYEETEFFEI